MPFYEALDTLKDRITPEFLRSQTSWLGVNAGGTSTCSKGGGWSQVQVWKIGLIAENLEELLRGRYSAILYSYEELLHQAKDSVEVSFEDEKSDLIYQNLKERGGQRYFIFLFFERAFKDGGGKRRRQAPKTRQYARPLTGLPTGPCARL